MKATLILADSAQNDGTGKVHALGAGWSVTGTPTPPMALIAFIDCPWDQTNTKHKLKIELLDADGHPVSFQHGPLGNPMPAFEIDAEFETGRPPGLPPGTPLREQLVIQLAPGMPLTPGQKYEFRLAINGEPMDSSLATFTIRP